MNTDPKEHQPLENIFRCLETDADDLTDAELKASLRERGLDPEATTAAVTEKVHGFLKSRRLSWQDAAKQKQAALQGLASKSISWSARKKEEIDAAFDAVRAGSLGAGAQGRIQVAFRNLSNIPTEDKASFLDEIDLLRQLNDKDPAASGDHE